MEPCPHRAGSRPIVFNLHHQSLMDSSTVTLPSIQFDHRESEQPAGTVSGPNLADGGEGLQGETESGLSKLPPYWSVLVIGDGEWAWWSKVAVSVVKFQPLESGCQGSLRRRDERLLDSCDVLHGHFSRHLQEIPAESERLADGAR